MTEKRVAFVTGGSRGIGEAIVRQLARGGMHVVALARNADKLNSVVAGNAGQANYAASKAGLIGLTKTVAKELSGKGVTCNVVAPGFISTDMTDALNEKTREWATGLIPLKRFGQPQEIASLVAFLA